MSDVFVKHGTPENSSLVGEAKALQWLGEAEPNGGMPVVKVVSVSSTQLVEERIMTAYPNAAVAERVGVALAITHASGAPWWGAPPTGWEGVYRIGDSFTPTVTKDVAPHSWGAFFAEWRVMPYVKQARDAGAIGEREVKVFERIIAAYDEASPLADG